MEGITYRLAGISDIESLVRLRVAMQAEVGHGDPSKEPELVAALRKYFAAALPSGEFLAYLAEHDGQIVAASGMVFHQHPPSGSNLTGREAYVMNMYTLPEFRTRGIATHLFQRLLRLARDMKCSRVVLYALPQGKAIYVKEGFVDNPGSMRLELR